MTRDSAETRRRLIAAADRLFYGQGIRAVGVDAVAEAAGVTKRTLYYHFASKDDLIAAYLEARDLPTLGRYQGLIPGPGEPATRQVRRLFEQLGRHAKDPLWRGCSFLRAASEFANLPGHPARVVAARHKKRFESWLEGVLVADGFAKPADLARQLMILFDGAVAQILIHRDPSYALSASDAAAALLNGRAKSKRKQRAASNKAKPQGEREKEGRGAPNSLSPRGRGGPGAKRREGEGALARGAITDPRSSRRRPPRSPGP